MLPCQKRQKGEMIPAQCPVSTSVNLLTLKLLQINCDNTKLLVNHYIWYDHINSVNSSIYISLLIFTLQYMILLILFITSPTESLTWMLTSAVWGRWARADVSTPCHTTPSTLFISTTWHLPAAARPHMSDVGCVRVRMSVCYEGVWLPGHMLWLQLLVLLCSFPGCAETDRTAFLGNTPLKATGVKSWVETRWNIQMMSLWWWAVVIQWFIKTKLSVRLVEVQAERMSALRPLWGNDWWKYGDQLTAYATYRSSAHRV